MIEEEEAADELLLPASAPTPWFRDLNILLVLAVTAFYLAVFKLLDELAPLFVSAPHSNVSSVVVFCTCLRHKCMAHAWPILHGLLCPCSRWSTHSVLYTWAVPAALWNTKGHMLH